MHFPPHWRRVHPYVMRADKREQGVVTSIKNGIGYLQCNERTSPVMFYATEVLDKNREVAVNDEVEFTVVQGPGFRHYNSTLFAIHIKHLPPNTVQFETLVSRNVEGLVIRGSANLVKYKDYVESGVITYGFGDEKTTIRYFCNGREQPPRIGDPVIFDIYFVKSSEQFIAVNVRRQNQQHCWRTFKSARAMNSRDFQTMQNQMHDEMLLPDRVCSGIDNEMVDYHGNCAEICDQDPFLATDDAQQHSASKIENCKFDSKNLHLQTCPRKDDETQCATSVSVVEEALEQPGERRELGVVITLKDTYGFLRCVDRIWPLFFHCTEILDTDRKINLNDEVEFTVVPDIPYNKSRVRAIRIKRLPPNSIQSERLVIESVRGCITRDTPLNPTKSQDRVEGGEITYYLENDEKTIIFYVKDNEQLPKIGDFVTFDIYLVIRNKNRIALNVRPLEQIQQLTLTNPTISQQLHLMQNESHNEMIKSNIVGGSIDKGGSLMFECNSGLPIINNTEILSTPKTDDSKLEDNALPPKEYSKTYPEKDGTINNTEIPSTPKSNDSKLEDNALPPREYSKTYPVKDGTINNTEIPSTPKTDDSKLEGNALPPREYIKTYPVKGGTINNTEIPSTPKTGDSKLEDNTLPPREYSKTYPVKDGTINNTEIRSTPKTDDSKLEGNALPPREYGKTYPVKDGTINNTEIPSTPKTDDSKLDGNALPPREYGKTYPVKDGTISNTEVPSTPRTHNSKLDGNALPPREYGKTYPVKDGTISNTEVPSTPRTHNSKLEGNALPPREYGRTYDVKDRTIKNTEVPSTPRTHNSKLEGNALPPREYGRTYDVKDRTIKNTEVPSTPRTHNSKLEGNALPPREYGRTYDVKDRTIKNTEVPSTPRTHNSKLEGNALPPREYGRTYDVKDRTIKNTEVPSTPRTHNSKLEGNALPPREYGRTYAVKDDFEMVKAASRRSETDRAISTSRSEKREHGLIISLKDGFGFLGCTERSLPMFFSFAEVLDRNRKLAVNDEVEFTVVPDPGIPQNHSRLWAIEIRHLPPNTIRFESLVVSNLEGSVTRHSQNNLLKLQDSIEGGVITYFQREVKRTVIYCLKECEIQPSLGERVRFDLYMIKRNKLLVALNVQKLPNMHRFELQQKPPMQPQPMLATKQQEEILKSDGGVTYSCTTPRLSRPKIENCEVNNISTPTKYGFISDLRKTFGFIETITHDDDVLFYYTNFVGNHNLLELGQEVEYTLLSNAENSASGNCLSAATVRALSKGSIKQPGILEGVHNGVIARPFRNVNHNQQHYAGLIDMLDDHLQTVLTQYKFGITSLIHKNDLLKKGDPVTFKIDETKHAAEVTPIRQKKHATLDYIKGQVGFLNYELGDGKKLFFHMSEFYGNTHSLRSGDTLEFCIVTNQRSGKSLACKVAKINEQSLRLHSARLRRDTPGMVVIRSPRGPSDKPFSLQARRPRLPGVLLD